MPALCPWALADLLWACGVLAHRDAALLGAVAEDVVGWHLGGRIGSRQEVVKVRTGGGGEVGVCACVLRGQGVCVCKGASSFPSKKRPRHTPTL